MRLFDLAIVIAALAAIGVLALLLYRLRKNARLLLRILLFVSGGAITILITLFLIGVLIVGGCPADMPHCDATIRSITYAVKQGWGWLRNENWSADIIVTAVELVIVYLIVDRVTEQFGSYKDRLIDLNEIVKQACSSITEVNDIFDESSPQQDVHAVRDAIRIAIQDLGKVRTELIRLLPFLEGLLSKDDEKYVKVSEFDKTCADAVIDLQSVSKKQSVDTMKKAWDASLVLKQFTNQKGIKDIIGVTITATAQKDKLGVVEGSNDAVSSYLVRR